MLAFDGSAAFLVPNYRGSACSKDVGQCCLRLVDALRSSDETGTRTQSAPPWRDIAGAVAGVSGRCRFVSIGRQRCVRRIGTYMAWGANAARQRRLMILSLPDCERMLGRSDAPPAGFKGHPLR